MKTIGIIVLTLTIGLAAWKFQNISVWSLALGVAIGAGCFALFPQTKQQAPLPSDEWKNRYHLLEAETARTVGGLNSEVQKLQQKIMRTEERCNSYQKLVDVHQNEIDKLIQEKNGISERLIEKDRKLGEKELAQMEPDLFDADKRQTEISLRELRKQFDEKSQKLDQAEKELKKKKTPTLSESRDLLS
jgi:chromosome segregation ATPase